MHIDPFSIIVFIIIISFLMSVGLYVVSRDYFTDVKGIRYWAMALLLMGLGWTLTALFGIIPHFFSMIMGTVLSLIGLVFYFRAFIEFKEIKVSLRWLYIVVIIAFLAHIYFVLISFNIAAKIVVTSLTVAVLLLANCFLLLTKQPNVCPRSHRVTASFFGISSCVYVIRAFYYLVWNTQSEQTLFQHNIIQDIAYLTNAVFIVGTTFGFGLMCNEKYFNEKNQTQLDLNKSVSVLNATIESTADALLVVSSAGDVVQYNSLFVKMWGISESLLDQRSNQLLLNFVLDQVIDKESFLSEIIDIDSRLYDENFSEVHFKDGRIIERYSKPHYLNDKPVGRVWSFRDVTLSRQIAHQLFESEKRFRDLFENAPLPYQSLDIQGNFLYVNQAWLELTGYEPNQVIGRFFGDFMTESSKSLVTQTVNQFIQEGCVSSPVFELIRSNNSEKLLVSVIGRVARDNKGKFQQTHCILRNITEQYRVEQELKESEEKFRLLIKKMPLALGLTNERGELIFINDRFKSTFGYTLEDIPTIKHWWQLAYPDESYRLEAIATWRSAVEYAARFGTDIEPLEYRITCNNGDERVILESGIEFSDGYLYTYVDITERKAAEEEIKQLAFYDSLTGLPNRRKLLDRLSTSIALNQRANTQFVVFMIDLDKFKAVNDSLGHTGGDELLKQVAARITQCLRDSDLVARLGGDEFVLILENLKIPEDAEIVALKVISKLTAPFQLSVNISVQIGASIGISIYPKHGNTPEILMDNADIALYKAKDNGRGCFAYFFE